jgi:hypothetical protein
MFLLMCIASATTQDYTTITMTRLLPYNEQAMLSILTITSFHFEQGHSAVWLSSHITCRSQPTKGKLLLGRALASFSHVGVSASSGDCGEAVKEVV